jgi:3-oxoacyl-[acyl-carrier-protein] synthase III
MKAVIGYMDCCIPESHLTVDEYVTLLDDSFLQQVGMKRNDLSGVLKNSIGIKRIYVEDRKNEAPIYCEMLEKYFAREQVEPEEIDFVIYTRGNSVALGDPWSMINDECVNVPYFLQKEFGLKNAQVFNVEQVCAGTLVGARFAFSLLKGGSARKILLLSSNFFTDQGDRLMGGLGLVSDAQAMMAISAGGPGLELLDFAGVTDGSITMVKDFRKGTIPAAIVQTGCDLIKSLLQKNHLTIDDIACIIPQNISKSGWNFYCQELEFPREKVFLDNFNDGGHMGDVDIIRNLNDALKSKLIAKDQYAILYGLGTGTSWNAVLAKAL